MKGKRLEMLTVIFGCSFLAAVIVSGVAASRGDNAVLQTMISALSTAVGIVIFSLLVT